VIYNNLIYLIIVIFLLSANTVPALPQIAPLPAFSLFIGKALAFAAMTRFFLAPRRLTTADQYFAAEQRLSMLAVFFLALDIYFLDCQYYITRLPLFGSLPVLTSLGGIVLFFAYLALIWAGGCRRYGRILGRQYEVWAFIRTNVTANLPIILPWLLLSLFFELLLLLPFADLQHFLRSSWGEMSFFVVFFLLLSVVFPLVITRIWRCRPMEVGPLRAFLENTCRRHKLAYADIMVWPLFEGKALTAGVMGLVGRFRYLLLTPALLRALTLEELEGVMAHEVGHVKRYHLQLYIFLLMGFGLIAQLGSYLFMYVLLKSDFFYAFSEMLAKKTDVVLVFISTMALLVLMVVYFRFVFAFFMRNFERQADLYALVSAGVSAPIINALEKVAALGGKGRDEPCWHHFGIGQRVDFLQDCEKRPAQVARHHRKVYLALVAYVMVLLASALTLWQLPSDLLEQAPMTRLAGLYQEKMVEEADNPMWPRLLGDLQHNRKEYGAAINAYEQALSLQPLQPDVMNNLAWLLLTAEVRLLRNPVRALMLARTAITLKQAGYIWDTLATAYAANGLLAEAMAVQEQAIASDPVNAPYYRQQLEKYQQLLEKD